MDIPIIGARAQEDSAKPPQCILSDEHSKNVLCCALDKTNGITTETPLDLRGKKNLIVVDLAYFMANPHVVHAYVMKTLSQAQREHIVATRIMASGNGTHDKSQDKKTT